jgi:hypothetical protein
MEEIILVTGFVRTKSWINVAFSGRYVDMWVSFGAEAFDDIGSGIDFLSSPEHIWGTMSNQGRV